MNAYSTIIIINALCLPDITSLADFDDNNKPPVTDRGAIVAYVSNSINIFLIRTTVGAGICVPVDQWRWYDGYVSNGARASALHDLKRLRVSTYENWYRAFDDVSNENVKQFETTKNVINHS